MHAIDYAEDSDTFGAVLPMIAGVSPRANEENVESRNRARSGFANVRAIEVVSGVLLIAVGLLIATDRLVAFNSYFTFLNDFVLDLEEKLL